MPKLAAQNIPFVFTDRHAYLQTASFFSDLARLDCIAWPLLQTRDFKKDVYDPSKFERYQAEALHLENPLNLKFTANKYGPYADNLRHLLNGLDGSYLHCEKRLSDAGPLEPICFEDSKADRVREFLVGGGTRQYLPALEKTAEVIDGFESPLGMELLATVDWLLSRTECAPTVPAVREAMTRWPGGRDAAQRKQRLFTDEWLGLALKRLSSSTLRPQPSLNSAWPSE